MDLNVPPTPVPKPPKREKKSKGSTFSCPDDGSQTIQNSLKRSGPLKNEGKRGKRLAKEDKKAADECHKLPCLCGCVLPPMWAHLIPRGAEETRHLPWNSVPACEYLHGWLDQGRGVQCKAEMLERAIVKGDRLEHDDVEDLLYKHDYYKWLYAERERRRI